MLRTVSSLSVAIGRKATKLARLISRLPGAPGRFIIRQWLIVRDEEVQGREQELQRVTSKWLEVRLQFHKERALWNHERMELHQQVGVLEDRLRTLDPGSRQHIRELRARRKTINQINEAYKHAHGKDLPKPSL